MGGGGTATKRVRKCDSLNTMARLWGEPIAPSHILSFPTGGASAIPDGSHLSTGYGVSAYAGATETEHVQL